MLKVMILLVFHRHLYKKGLARRGVEHGLGYIISSLKDFIMCKVPSFFIY
jgi:hypothetical protein